MKYEKDNLKKSIIRPYSIEENLLHVDMVVVMIIFLVTAFSKAREIC